MKDLVDLKGTLKEQQEIETYVSDCCDDSLETRLDKEHIKKLIKENLELMNAIGSICSDHIANLEPLLLINNLEEIKEEIKQIIKSEKGE